MKNRIIFLSLIALIFLCPVARGEVFMDYDFAQGLVWQVGGFEAYDIIQRGEVIGEARVDYSSLEMLDEDAIRLEWAQSWVDSDDESMEIDIDVKMHADDLKALMATHLLTIGEEEWTFEGNYTGESLVFGSYYPGEAERREASLTRGGRFADADVLPFLLRNIPFEDGNFVTLTVVDVRTQSFVTPIASVMGSELVETSNTQYDCWVVNVSLGNNGFTAWYSKTENHYLVKIRYSDRDIVLNHHS